MTGDDGRALRQADGFGVGGPERVDRYNITSEDDLRAAQVAVGKRYEASAV